MERNYYAVIPEGGPSAESAAGMALVATYPFWIFVDRSARLEPHTVEIQGVSVRVYPPFRTSPANHLPLPDVKPKAIPFLDEAASRYSSQVALAPLAVVPNLLNGEPNLIWGDEWTSGLPCLPMDAMRLDVFPAAGGPVCASVMHRIIGLLRYRTRQWWIGNSLAGMVDTIRCGFFVQADGSPMERPHSRASTSKLFGDEQCLNAEIWEGVLDELRSERCIPLPSDLLLDARWFAVGGNRHRALLEAAIAAETETKQTFVRVLKRKGIAFKAGKHLRGHSLADWVDGDLKRVTGLTYRTRSDNKIDWIRRLWSVRGRIAHGLPAAYLANKRLVEVDDDALIVFLHAAEHLVDWLQSL